MKKLTFVAVLVAVAAFPATAGAKKYADVVSIHYDSQFFAEEIFGSVESGKPKCEKGRTIKLFYAPFNGGKRRGAQFEQIDETTTDNAGEYLFTAAKDAKRGNPIFNEGEYFSRVTKKIVGDDTCLKDDSRVIEVFTECFQRSTDDAEAARRGGIC